MRPNPIRIQRNTAPLTTICKEAGTCGLWGRRDRPMTPPHLHHPVLGQHPVLRATPDACWLSLSTYQQQRREREARRQQEREQRRREQEEKRRLEELERRRKEEEERRRAEEEKKRVEREQVSSQSLLRPRVHAVHGFGVFGAKSTHTYASHTCVHTRTHTHIQDIRGLKILKSNWNYPSQLSLLSLKKT